MYHPPPPLTVSPLVPLVSSCSARKFSTTSSTDEDMDDKFLSDSSGTSVESSVFVKDQVGDAAAAAAAAATAAATATEAAAVLHVSPVSTDGFLSSLEHLLSLRQVDPHTFTNCSELFVPYRGRGLFGGTLAAQATLAALLFTNTEDKKWKPISLHCHFLYAATPSPALFYKVHSLKDGKNYCTRSVDLYQDDRLIFRATCSLQAYELAGSAAKLDGQLSHYRQGPEVGKDIEPPEEMFSQEEAFFAWSQKAYKHRHLGYLKTALEDVTASYAREPCVWRLPLGMFDLEHVSEAEREMVPSDRTLRYWVKTKEALKDPHVFSWVALAYISDYFFLSTNMRLNMREMFTTKFSVSLDHTIYFDKEIDVSEWFNYNVKSLKSGENRTIMTGEMFSRDGELLASTYQEGLSVVFTD
ncbi:DEKNAAC104305 [Brettanomyces naardenensis]|uniref:DEKNAAC104305 n=1 Tax=Brettanomyces naardenensis TaxID=13370 RepID=A0A448YQS5_BRENA|nr:DEKNAAC104305 [Brettanomyces naardenensis]